MDDANGYADCAMYHKYRDLTASILATAPIVDSVISLMFTLFVAVSILSAFHHILIALFGSVIMISIRSLDWIQSRNRVQM